MVTRENVTVKWPALIGGVVFLLSLATLLVSATKDEGVQNIAIATTEARLVSYQSSNDSDHRNITSSIDQLEQSVKESSKDAKEGREEITRKLDELTKALNLYMIEEASKKKQ